MSSIRWRCAASEQLQGNFESHNAPCWTRNTITSCAGINRGAMGRYTEEDEFDGVHRTKMTNDRQRPALQRRPTVLRLACLRCAKSAEMLSTDEATTYDMVMIGFNLYYCSRCARATGYCSPVTDEPSTPTLERRASG
ncbi:uncharacterized protein E0L32_007011 [Thyridium curvatum]|uniref:Uncharacterized protein n=1 Tax=Thyridium curvatum TaxID=1093900 RepID=A0A507B0X6_9PEZI|nr:uncharacterized protein E0L32_007011 [Thyridium curvatum]TPX12364.1 hypothetical protein E0L32_007011 [Thyridium curvatum]